MSEVTEIYVCKPGQALKEGKLEYSSTITRREEAEADALRRCRSDATIARIAYYAIDESGKFRNFYTYENPNAAKPAPRRAASAPAAAGRSRRRREKPTLIRRIRAFFEED